MTMDDQVIKTTHDDSLDLPAGTNSRGVMFLVGLASVSALAGFGYTMSSARKIDPVAFSQGLQLFSSSSAKYSRPESGIRLALRAFGCASLITVTGISCLSAVVWMCTGAHGWKDFNRRMSGLFPNSWRLKSKNPSTNFKTFDELYNYITSSDLSDQFHQPAKAE